MIDEYYDAGGDHAHLDLGLEKAANIGAAFSGLKALGSRVAPHIGRLSTQAGKAWQAAAPAAKATETAQPGIRAAIGRAWDNTAGRAWGSTVGRAWNAGKTFAAPAGEAVEHGVTTGVGGILGRPGEQITRKLIKGVPGQAAKDALIFGGVSAGLEGGLGAAMADDGDRLKAFAEGAGHGALSGAAMGGLMGGMGGAMKNLRRSSLTQAAQRGGARGSAAAAQAEKQLERGFFGSIKDTAMGGGNLGHAGSAQNVAGGLGQFGAEWLAPMAVLPASLGGGNPFKAETWGFGGGTPVEQPQQMSPATQARLQAYRQQQQQLQQLPQQPTPQMKTGEVAPEPTTMGIEDRHIKAPARLVATLGGGAATGIPTGIALDALKSKSWYPGGTKGSLLARTGQTLGTAAGVIGGHYLGQKMLPPPEPESDIDKKLEQIDFDKLMRYYKKREAEQV